MYIHEEETTEGKNVKLHVVTKNILRFFIPFFMLKLDIIYT